MKNRRVETQLEKNIHIHSSDVDLQNRRIYLFGEIGTELSKMFIKNLHFLSTTVEPIEIIINSGGGSWNDGIAIYGAIRNCANQVTGVVLGDCSSMASIILQACDKRIMDKDASMLIHPGFSAVDGPVLDVISRTEWEKTVLTQMYDIYYDRAVKINKNLKLNQLRKYFSMDRYLASEDALKFGLVDSII